MIINDIQPKPWTRNGVTRQSPNDQGTYHAEVMPKRSIRIFGVMTNHIHGPQTFNKTFKVGDRAEYNSYNLKYVGTIVAIGAKTVKVKHYAHSSEVTQLGLYEFVDRNWDFDGVKIAKYNAEEMQCL